MISELIPLLSDSNTSSGHALCGNARCERPRGSHRLSRICRTGTIYAARTSFAEKVACVIDTVVPFESANVTT